MKRNIHQSAEIAALKAELAQCRELADLRLQSEQAEQAKAASKPGLAITDELRTNIQRTWLGR